MTEQVKKRVKYIRQLLDAIENDEDILYWEDHGDGGFWRKLSSWCKPNECNWLLEDVVQNYKLLPGSNIRKVFDSQFMNHKIVKSYNSCEYFDIADNDGHCRFYRYLSDLREFAHADDEFTVLKVSGKLVADPEEYWRN